MNFAGKVFTFNWFGALMFMTLMVVPKSKIYSPLPPFL